MEPRQMVSNNSEGYTVLEDGTALATDVSFEAAHEFVHQGCQLCAADEDHTGPSVHRESAWLGSATSASLSG